MTLVLVAIVFLGLTVALALTVWLLTLLIQRTESMDAPTLTEHDRWRLRSSITMLESALHEIDALSAKNGTIRDMESALRTTLIAARHTLNESRRRGPNDQEN